MIFRYNLRSFFLVVILFFLSSRDCHSQNSSIELWPEVDAWYRLNPSWRVSSFIALTKYNENDSRDINMSAQVDYAWGKTKHTIFRRLVDQEKAEHVRAWMVRGGFMKGWSIGQYAGDYNEEMIFSEIHKRIPLTRNFLLSQRFRNDLRWLGEDDNFSYRLRYRLLLEKEFQHEKYSLVPYVSFEPYWDSRYSKITRVRAIAGITNTWKKNYALEGNFTYQNDDTYNTKNLYAFNVILHIYFQR